jgi:hypothetical protein
MELLYRMRQRFQPEGRAYREPAVPADLGSLTPAARELLDRYPYLMPRLNRLSRPTLEKLFGHLDLLDRLGGTRLPLRSGRVLDVGAADWLYLGGLTSWLVERTGERPLEIMGIEVDPHRFDSSFVTSASKARHQMEVFSSEQVHLDYQGGNFNQVFGKFDLITWMFPTFSMDAVRKHGLVTELFQPDELLKHADRILDSSGYILFANEGFWEWEALQERVVALDLPWRLERVSEAREHLHVIDTPVYVSLWSKG